MPDRKDAGVPAKTAFSKDVEGPQRILGDGIAGGPVAVHRFAGKVFKKGFGTPGFLPEGFRRLPVNQLVTITVGGNLMACATNLPNQFRVVFRYPAQHKEGCLDLVPFEQIKKLAGVLFHTGRQGWPLVRFYYTG